MKNVLVVGASGDIGRAIVKQLANENYQFMLHYHQNKQAMEKLLEHVDSSKILQVIQADLSTEDGANNLYEQVAFSVHAIIYVSGLTQHQLFSEVDEETMDKMLILHVKSPWLITQKRSE